MDVDGNEDETQQPLQVKNYDIEVDFTGLPDESKEVSLGFLQSKLMCFQSE